MQSQPLCVWCEEEGITKPGDIVDHIKEISDGGDPFDQNNLQTMCHKHHNQKTKWAAKKRYKPNTETRGISSAG